MKIKEELAHRMSKLKPSGIRKIFEIASKREDIINLSIGEPDFDVPAELKNEAIKAIHRNESVSRLFDVGPSEGRTSRMAAKT